MYGEAHQQNSAVDTHRKHIHIDRVFPICLRFPICVLSPVSSDVIGSGPHSGCEMFCVDACCHLVVMSSILHLAYTPLGGSVPRMHGYALISCAYAPAFRLSWEPGHTVIISPCFGRVNHLTKKGLPSPPTSTEPPPTTHVFYIVTIAVASCKIFHSPFVCP